MLTNLFARLRRYRRPLVALALVATAVFGFAHAAYAAGLVQVDYANDPWVLAIVGLLGIGGVASVLGSVLDKASAALGITTEALLWLLCFGVSLVVTLVRGGIPLWGGDGDTFIGAVIETTIAARGGAAVIYGLFLARLRPIQEMVAPAVAPAPEA